MLEIVLSALKSIHEKGGAVGVALLALAGVGFIQYVLLPAEDDKILHTTQRVTNVEQGIRDIRVEQLESKLDLVYTALCMRPGDSDLLERIRDLQKKHEDATSDPPIRGWRYPPPDCNLLLKVK